MGEIQNADYSPLRDKSAQVVTESENACSWPLRNEAYFQVARLASSCLWCEVARTSFRVVVVPASFRGRRHERFDIKHSEGLKAMRWLSVLMLSAAVMSLLLIGCGPKVRPDLPPDADHVAKIRTGLVGSGGGDAGADGGATAAAQQPTGWATLRGRFELTGTAPSRQPLNVNKETEVCAPGGIQVLSEELVVGSNGEIKDVVVYLTSKIPDDEPWTHPSAKPGSNTEPVVFDQKQCLFLTHVVAMQVSQPLRILNSDPIGHNTNLSPRSNPGFNQIIPSGTPGVMYQPTSEESAPFPVACSIHPWMESQMLIRKNGYFAVTAEDGSFEIPNLPAGVELEFRVWQEKAKFVENVTVNGESTKWSKGRLVLTLDPADQSQNELMVQVSL